MKKNQNNSDLLEELKAKRSENIDSLKKWPIEDIVEMLKKYSAAKELASDQQKEAAAMLLDEKISQMSAVLEIKQQPEQSL